jgi:hypothetical protein
MYYLRFGGWKEGAVYTGPLGVCRAFSDPAEPVENRDHRLLSEEEQKEVTQLASDGSPEEDASAHVRNVVDVIAHGFK